MGKVTKTSRDSRIAQDVITVSVAFDLRGWCGAGQRGGVVIERRAGARQP